MSAGGGNGGIGKSPPHPIALDDHDRLEALCTIYGVGLVLFDLNVDDPKFQIVTKPQRFQPDMFYANEFARRLAELSPAEFNRLFQ